MRRWSYISRVCPFVMLFVYSTLSSVVCRGRLPMRYFAHFGSPFLLTVLLKFQYFWANDSILSSYKIMSDKSHSMSLWAIWLTVFICVLFASSSQNPPRFLPELFITPADMTDLPSQQRYNGGIPLWVFWLTVWICVVFASFIFHLKFRRW